MIPRQKKEGKTYKNDPGVMKQLRIIKRLFEEADTIIEEARVHAKADAERERAKYLAELSDVVIDAAAKIAANSHTAEGDSSLYDAFIENAFDKGTEKKD